MFPLLRRKENCFLPSVDHRIRQPRLAAMASRGESEDKPSPTLSASDVDIRNTLEGNYKSSHWRDGDSGLRWSSSSLASTRKRRATGTTIVRRDVRQTGRERRATTVLGKRKREKPNRSEVLMRPATRVSGEVILLPLRIESKGISWIGESSGVSCEEENERRGQRQRPKRARGRLRERSIRRERNTATPFPLFSYLNLSVVDLSFI